MVALYCLCYQILVHHFHSAVRPHVETDSRRFKAQQYAIHLTSYRSSAQGYADLSHGLGTLSSASLSMTQEISQAKRQIMPVGPQESMSEPVLRVATSLFFFIF